MRPEHIDVLIAGAGLAGSRTAETLRALGFEGRVLVAGEEPHVPYERPALSKAYLAGRSAARDLVLRDGRYWSDHGIELWTGADVERVDTRRRTALVGGRTVSWGRLVVATGVRGRRLPALDRYANVHQLRTLDDAARLAQAMSPGMRLAVIGAGFVGLEVASTARELGCDVVVIEMAAVPFAATLGSQVGERLAAIADGEGVKLRMGRRVTEVVAERDRVEGLVLDDGACVPCDAVLVGIGALPNSELVARSVALATDGGVAVDWIGRTTVPGVYACGDVATSIDHGRTEHWSAAAATARTVAHAVAGAPAPDQPVPYFWTEQFGHRLQVVGTPHPDGSSSSEPRERGFVVRYHDSTARLRAVALLDRPELLAGARAEIMAARTDTQHSTVA